MVSQLTLTHKIIAKLCGMISNNRIRKCLRKYRDVTSNKKIENKDETRKYSEKIFQFIEGKLNPKSWLQVVDLDEFQYKTLKSNCAINEYLRKLQEEKDLSFSAKFEDVLAAFSKETLITTDIKYMCQLLNNTWAVISDNSLLNVRLSSELKSAQLVYEIPLTSIREIMTDPEHRIIHLIYYEDSNPSTSTDICFKKNDRNNNAHFISFLVVTISASRQSKDLRTTEVTWVPSLLDIPPCKNMRNHFKGESMQLQGFCLAYRLELSPSFREELMMQKGNEKYNPVIITLQDRTLSILAKAGQDGIPKKLFSIDTCQISSLKRVESPRPHSLLLIWKSITLHIAASNDYTIGLLFDVINFVRRKPVIVHGLPEPAHIIITDMSMVLFSAQLTKSLLLRVPLLNILKAETVEEDWVPGFYSIIIDVDNIEADENTLAFDNLNLQWCLSFSDESEMQKYTNLLSQN